MCSSDLGDKVAHGGVAFLNVVEVLGTGIDDDGAGGMRGIVLHQLTLARFGQVLVLDGGHLDAVVDGGRVHGAGFFGQRGRRVRHLGGDSAGGQQAGSGHECKHRAAEELGRDHRDPFKATSGRRPGKPEDGVATCGPEHCATGSIFRVIDR